MGGLKKLMEAIFVKMMRDAAKVKARATRKEADRNSFGQNGQLFNSAANIAEAEYAYWKELSKNYSITLGEGIDEVEI